ncbi:MAG: DUF2157 domain-containing protein [Proteobacteria bacterium]|nr:DUF2157 domain-containing protein [Pseudomonadota bacterium]
MTAEKLNRQVRMELTVLAEMNLISLEQREKIAERYPAKQWDLVTLIRWFSILGAVAMGAGLIILSRHLTFQRTLIEAGLFLLSAGCVGGGLWAERRLHLPKVGAALQLLGAIVFQGLSLVLAIHYSTGFGNWPAVVGIDCVIFFLGAYLLRNRLLLIYATANFFVWFGGQTGYVSGWGAYWLGMTYPLRFLLAGLASLGAAYLHLRYIPPDYRPFTRVYAHFGLSVIHLALWFLALFGYFELKVRWEGTEIERLLFSFLWAGVSLGCIFGANPSGFQMLRGYGMTFLIVNLYTFYFNS